MPYGVPQLVWNEASEEARSILIECAKRGGTITYSDLVRGIRAFHFAPHEQRFFHLIGEISRVEDAAGRGMLSVVVVHKSGDMQPGPGFFELAKLLGRDTRDILSCWINELRKVHTCWGRLI